MKKSLKVFVLRFECNGDGGISAIKRPSGTHEYQCEVVGRSLLMPMTVYLHNLTLPARLILPRIVPMIHTNVLSVTTHPAKDITSPSPMRKGPIHDGLSAFYEAVSLPLAQIII